MRLNKRILAVVLTSTLSLGAQGQSAAAKKAALLDPGNHLWSEHAPDTVTADVETSKGTIAIQLVRAWAPAGVDRFYNLARAGYYDDSRIYRVIYGFAAQFGIAGNPAVYHTWGGRYLPAEQPHEKNVRGTVSFAQNKPGDRATNVFINLSDNPSLDTLKFAPIGRVVAGMDVADSLNFRYGEGPASPAFGNPKRLYSETNKYLDEAFPKLDRILKITVHH